MNNNKTVFCTELMPDYCMLKNCYQISVKKRIIIKINVEMKLTTTEKMVKRTDRAAFHNSLGCVVSNEEYFFYS